MHKKMHACARTHTHNTDLKLAKMKNTHMILPHNCTDSGGQTDHTRAHNTRNDLGQPSKPYESLGNHHSKAPQYLFTATHTQTHLSSSGISTWSFHAFSLLRQIIMMTAAACSISRVRRKALHYSQLGEIQREGRERITETKGMKGKL